MICVEGRGNKSLSAYVSQDEDEVIVTITLAYPDGTCKQITLSALTADILGAQLQIGARDGRGRLIVDPTV